MAALRGTSAIPLTTDVVPLLPIWRDHVGVVGLCLNTTPNVTGGMQCRERATGRSGGDAIFGRLDAAFKMPGSPRMLSPLSVPCPILRAGYQGDLVVKLVIHLKSLFVPD